MTKINYATVRVNIFRSIVITLCAIFVCPVQSGVITFDDVPAMGNSNRLGELTVDGFDFYVRPYLGNIISDPSLCYTTCSDNGTQWIYTSSDSLRMSKTNGSAFSLAGFEMAEAFANYGLPKTLDLTGHFIDGSSAVISFDFDRIRDGIGPLYDFQEISLNEEWKGLRSIEFYSLGAFGIDNIVYVSVSEPGMFPLLFAGILLLLVFRKRGLN